MVSLQEADDLNAACSTKILVDDRLHYIITIIRILLNSTLFSHCDRLEFLIYRIHLMYAPSIVWKSLATEVLDVLLISMGMYFDLILAV
jgi:hypothetical protein